MLGKIFVGFDIETGSPFDLPESERKILTELGAVKYVFTKTGFKPIDVWNTVINEGKGVHPDCIEYTGITPKLVEDFGIPLKSALESFESFISDADFFMTQNGDCFDLPLIKWAFKECGLEWTDRVNIDTKTCVSYPNNCKQRNLTYLQSFYGFANPFQHRAFTDVMTMFKVVDEFIKEENFVKQIDIVESMKKICEVAASPNVRYKAVFQYPKEKDYPNREAYKVGMDLFNKMKDEVKNAGFRWHPETKTWIYEGKELIFERDIKQNLSCQIVRIKE